MSGRSLNGGYVTPWVHLRVHSDVYPTRSAQALWRCGIGAARVSWSAGEGAGGAAAARTASDDHRSPRFSGQVT